ncbi:hypothetical protein RI138_13645 [Streptomyces sp. C11-1]|uniref:Adenylate kinase n=1 Tax=Streptomyces durocortorensis TaxID=2811104 RepID=A0ABY9W191_9ACTN|nr:hypothetical protein [Streptomyces durocortorensis]WNF27782.1 hypothetical protein RI138_13645 [Streptomyces durocortorensis]
MRVMNGGEGQSRAMGGRDREGVPGEVPVGDGAAAGDGPADRVPGRVVVLGTSGAGKSTLGAPLAALIGAAHSELDRFQHGPNWTQATPEEFRKKVLAEAESPRWLFDGNYIDRVAADLWPRADLIVWLNPPLPVILRRLFVRSLKRIVLRTELWGGNREGWGALFSRNSVLRWAVRSNRRHVEELPGRLAELEAQGVEVVRLRSGAAARAWSRAMDERVRARVTEAFTRVAAPSGEPGTVLDAADVLPKDCADCLAATFPDSPRTNLIERGRAATGAGTVAPVWRAAVDGLLAAGGGEAVIRASTRWESGHSETGDGVAPGARTARQSVGEEAVPADGASLRLRFVSGSGHGVLTVEYAQSG